MRITPKNKCDTQNKKKWKNGFFFFLASNPEKESREIKKDLKLKSKNKERHTKKGKLHLICIGFFSLCV